MDNLPVEVVGIILSRLEAANDVLRASSTCRKWRIAFRYYLRSLKFHFEDSPAYFKTKSEIGNFITKTIFQTSGLQELSITMEDGDEGLYPYPASTVTAWLFYVRETLKNLCIRVKTNADINLLDIYGRQKLEKLVVFYNTIMGVEPKYHLLPCLTSLSLNHLSISSVDLNLLLTACPKIETLSLFLVDIMASNDQVTLELDSPSLKAIYVKEMTLDKFILEADSLEELHLIYCCIGQVNFLGKGSLKHFEHKNYDHEDQVSHLDLGEVNLEIVDVSNFSRLIFRQMIFRSSNLKVLRLWPGYMDGSYLAAIAKSFPYLTNFSFICDEGENWLDFIEEGSYQLQNLVVLEVGWTEIHDQFCPVLESFLEECPNLKKLNIHGEVSNTQTPEEYQILADLTSSMIRLMRKYSHVDVHFKYK
ncbi:F-box/LRR-repeat protein At1g67190-like isoform X2 [Silene latifolia]|uniref:F-box/LRR-repeat protein At1g67190-like isoform X2 n=1 Tax=Silene latifolia TaxID=37657 RepID=UPI003D776655